MVLTRAQKWSRILRYDSVYSELLLLSIMSEKRGIAFRALKSLGLSEEKVRAEVIRRLGTGRCNTFDELPFSRSAKCVIELAAQIGSKRVGTDHLLLAMIEDNTCSVPAILQTLGVDRELLRSRIAQLRQTEEIGEEPIIMPAINPMLPTIIRMLAWFLWKIR